MQHCDRLCIAQRLGWLQLYPAHKGQRSSSASDGTHVLCQCVCKVDGDSDRIGDRDGAASLGGGADMMRCFGSDDRHVNTVNGGEHERQRGAV